MSKKGVKKGNKSKKVEDSTPQLFAMGELDLIFKIEFKKDDLEKSESSSDKEKESSSNNDDGYYKLEDLNELKDLSFLKDNEDLWDKIQLKPGNETLKVLLIGNKNNRRKCQMEYICYGRPSFEEDEEFFEEIFDHVTAKNGLNINKTPLDEGARYSIKIEMKYGKETKTIEIGKTEENDEDKEENKDEKEENEEKEEGGEEEEEDDYEENDAMIDKRIPKFKRSKSVLCNLDPSSTRDDMIYLNFEDFSKIPGDFKLDDMVELLAFFKKKNSTIFINYYKKETPPPPPEEKNNQKNKKEENKKKEDKQNKENEEKKE